MSGRTEDLRARLLKLQRDLFLANQRQINDTVESYTDEFRRYEAGYRRSVRTSRGPVSSADLERAIRAAQVVLVGDYHTFSPAQRTFLRLLRAETEPRVTIALEMLPSAHDALIERYLAGRLSEATLQKRIDYKARWPFAPFSAFGELFELARERGYRIVGLEPEGAGGLRARDQAFAERVALARAGGGKVYVLVGDLHLAPAHLPRAIRREMAKRRLDGLVLRVHQNPDALWFELAEKSESFEDDIHRVDDDGFALFSASPIVLQQSFLTWLESHEEASEEPAGFDPEASERIVDLSIRAIGSALELPVERALADLTVTGPRDLSFFEGLGRTLSRRELRQLRQHILSGESCYVPKAELIYLATLSLNHAAEEASHRFRHVLSGEGLHDPKAATDAFYARVLNEAIGFVGSRFVNPKRAAPTVEELEDIARRRTGIDARAAHFALLHKRLERGEAVPAFSEVFDADPKIFHGVAHVLGYMLGDQLYAALHRAKIDLAEVRGLYAQPLEPPGAALLLYFELATRLAKLARPPRRIRYSTVGRRQLSGA